MKGFFFQLLTQFADETGWRGEATLGSAGMLMQQAIFCLFFCLLICLIELGSNARIDCSCLLTLSVHTVNYYFTFGLKFSLFFPRLMWFLILPKFFQKSISYRLQYLICYVKYITSCFLELFCFHLHNFSLYFVYPEKLYILATNKQNHNQKIADALCLATCLADFENEVLMVPKCHQNSVGEFFSPYCSIFNSS